MQNAQILWLRMLVYGLGLGSPTFQLKGEKKAGREEY